LSLSVCTPNGGSPPPLRVQIMTPSKLVLVLVLMLMLID